MVMGVQRSGTTALFISLAHDPSLWPYLENESDEFYDQYFLRPEREIQPLLLKTPGTLLLKPISESRHRSLADIFNEYAAYDLSIAWIYRDPVNVIYSGHAMGWYGLEHYEYLAQDWSRRNKTVLDGLPHYRERVILVQYCDLIADWTIFRRLCQRLGVTGENKFRVDSNAGRNLLAAEIQQKIDAITAQTMADLNRARTYRPSNLRQKYWKWRRSFKKTLRRWLRLKR